LITFVYSKAYLHDPFREDEYPDKDLHFMQVVGVEEKLRAHVRETMDKLKKMNIWLLSGDSNNRVVPVAYKSGILDPSDNVIQFDDP
jgi:magnesium-transporting ATPase (P-type)